MNQTMTAISQVVQEYSEIETRITILKAIPALIAFDSSVIGSDMSGYKLLIEALLNLLQDT